MKRTFGFVMALVVLCTLVAAPVFATGAGEASDEGPVTIEYWHINSATFGEQAVINSVERFHELHPDIRVEQRFQQGSYGGLLQNLQAAIAAGNPPAVTQIGYNNRLFAFTELPHTPIEQFSDDPEYDEFVGGFIDGLVGLGQGPDGVQRAVPYALSVPVVYYNADLFRAAGLNPNSPPETWTELRAAARQIRERTGEYGVGMQISTSNNWLPQTLVESNGGFFRDPATGEIGVDRPETIEVYRFWQAMAQEDDSLPVITDAEQEQAFLAGRLGMYVKTSAAMSNISAQASFELRTAPVPSWGNKLRRIASGGNALFIFAQDPRQQRAAYEFVKFLSSQEGQTIWVLDTGYLPMAAGVNDDPEYLAGYFEENPLTQAALNQLPDSVAWAPFPGPRGQEAEQVLIEAREAILDGAPVEPTLREAAARLRNML